MFLNTFRNRQRIQPQYAEVQNGKPPEHHGESEHTHSTEVRSGLRDKRAGAQSKAGQLEIRHLVSESLNRRSGLEHDKALVRTARKQKADCKGNQNQQTTRFK